MQTSKQLNGSSNSEIAILFVCVVEEKKKRYNFVKRKFRDKMKREKKKQYDA